MQICVRDYNYQHQQANSFQQHFFFFLNELRNPASPAGRLQVIIWFSPFKTQLSFPSHIHLQGEKNIHCMGQIKGNYDLFVWYVLLLCTRNYHNNREAKHLAENKKGKKKQQSCDLL